MDCNKHIQKLTWARKYFQICFYVSGAAVTATFVLSYYFLYPIIPLLISFVFLCFFGIINNCLSWRCNIDKKWVVILKISSWAIPFLIINFIFIRTQIVHVYTPAAINQKNLDPYNKTIQFILHHNNYNNWSLQLGLVFIENRILRINFPNPDYPRDIDEYFSEIDVEKLRYINSELYYVNCHKFQRVENVVLFYKYADSIIPTGPGVAYSIDGSNPNDIENDVLVQYKPFCHIQGKWYASKSLMLRGWRSDIPYSLPSSLIDHSLIIDENVFKKDAANKS